MKQASNVTFDLTNDEGRAAKSAATMVWDKKKKNFVKGGGVGADNVKMVRTENGTRLPATYRSGRFDEWKNKSRTSLPRIGEAENPTHGRKPTGAGGHRFKHNKTETAKPLDKKNHDFERKVRQQKKKETASEASTDAKPYTTPGGKKMGVRTKSYGRIKTELKTSAQIRKNRKVMDNRRAKNARPSHRGGGGGGRKGKR